MQDHSTNDRSSYPQSAQERDRWILARRPARSIGDPDHAHGVFFEKERSQLGAVVDGVTVLLTNRECPWRCVMCDLWKTTVTESVPLGAIPRQIKGALERLGVPGATRPSQAAGSASRRAGPAAVWPSQIKLYNGGSFFDPRAIPRGDYETIAELAAPFGRVVVECHPAFVREDCLVFRDALAAAARAGGLPVPQLEVAMGLETAHPQVLEKLNKRMTLDQFGRASQFLQSHGIDLRVFVLVQPPFEAEATALDWCQRSVRFAFDAGATVVSLIATRGGNGAMEALEELGQFTSPKLSTLESAHAQAIKLGRGRVFADVWGLEAFSKCTDCFAPRLGRIEHMNFTQSVLEPISCAACGAGQDLPEGGV